MPESVRDVALEYAAKGWRVVPCDGKSPHVAGKNWQKNARATGAWIDRHWTESDPDKYNIGVLTGDGFIVVDIDPRNGGNETWAQIQRAHKPPADPAVESVTGAYGRHLYFAWDDTPIVSSLGPGVDIKHRGGQVIEYPSIHPETGNQYDWVENKDPRYDGPPQPPPEWLKNLLTKSNASDGAPERFASWAPWGDWMPDELARVQAAIREIEADVEYPVWIQIGQALHSSGMSQAFSVWDEWSSWGASYKSGECAKKWRSFNMNGAITMGTLFHIAEEHGWTGDYEGERMPPPPVPVVRKRRLVDEAPSVMPDDLLQVDGLLGDLCEWMNATARYKQPALALGGALTLVSLLSARKAQTATGLGLNIYVVNVSNSGTGKATALDAIGEVIANMTGPYGDSIAEKLFIGDSAASGPGIVAELENHPVGLLRIDEIGINLFKKILNPKAAAHHTDIKGVLNAFATGSTKPFMGRAKASTETVRRVIQHPCLTLFGAATPGQIFDTLSMADAEDGFLGRFTFFWGNPNRGRPNWKMHGYEDMFDDIVKTCNALYATNAENGHDSDTAPTVFNVPMDDDARGFFDRLERLATEKIDGGLTVWARADALAMKLATLRAISYAIKQGPTVRPVVNAEYAQWGCRLAEYLTERYHREAASRMAGSEHEGIQKEIISILKSSDTGKVAKTYLTRKLRKYKPRDRNDALASLEEAGTIGKEKGERTNGRTATVYYIAEG